MKKLFIAKVRILTKLFPHSARLRNFLMWPIATRVFRGKYTDVVHLKAGIAMKADLGDMLGRVIVFYGPDTEYIWEPSTVRLMEMIIKDAKEVLVAGSHLGYLVLAARKAMQGGRVHTFEPAQYLYGISKENFDMNEDLGSIQLTRAGLAEKSGSAKFVIDNLKSHIAEGATDGETEDIDLVSLDDYAKKQNISAFDFMLLDVEGYEVQVFKGARNMLGEKPPRDVIFELSPKVGDIEKEFSDITKELLSYSYSYYYIEDNYHLDDIRGYAEKHNVTLKSIDDVAAFTRERYFNVLATKRSKKDLEGLGIQVI